MTLSSLQLERIPGPAPAGSGAFRPHGGNLTAFLARDPEVLVEGPAGTGKSRACLELLHLRATKYPRSRHAIVRKTRESLNQSALVTYTQEVMVPADAVRFNHETQEFRYGNGSRVVVGGLDKASKVMSSQYDTIYVQEATELERSDWEALSSRLRNSRMPYAQLQGDCNPDAPTHWLNQRCIAGGTRRVETRHEDNPTVTPDYLARLDRLSGALYQRLRLGRWVMAEGAYFTEWDENKHVCPAFPIPPSWTFWCSLDYGYGDPFCALWFARNPDDRYHIYVYREAYARGLRAAEQAKAVSAAREGERIQWYIADPSVFARRTESQLPSIAYVYASGGLRPLAPGVNERKFGWSITRATMATEDPRGPRLQVMRGRAPNLVRTIPSMVVDALDSEDLADKVRSVKTEDHAVDALRYGLVLEAMPPAQQSKLKDFAFEAG